MKKILLLMVAALFLCGVTSAQNWGTPDSHAKSSNTPIVAKVTLGETVQEAGTLGAFVGNELRGLATIHTDGNFWIQAFYNEGETNPDEFTFKFYDGEQEYTNCTTALTGQEEGYGTPNSPVELVFAATQTQSVALVNGWNWWSTNIELEGNNGLQQLKNELGTSCVKIKSRTDGNLELLNMGGNMMWLGNLNAIHNEQMYMIQTNAACDVAISGQRVTPSSHPITINNGWNWIGYLSNQSQSIANALGDFVPSNGDKIKGRNGSADYLAAMNMWLGNLTSFEPGQGYMYMSNSEEEKTIEYQTSRQESYIADNNSSDLVFKPEVSRFAFNMSVIAVVELDGDELRSDDYELSAFVGDECRGSVKLMFVEPLNRYMAFLLIFGDKEESVHFVLTDGKDASRSNDNVLYSDNGVLGSLTEPVVLHFGPLGLNENNQTVVNVYPNPSKGVFRVEGNNLRKVEVINIYGQIVYSQEVKSDNLQIDLRKRASGKYLLRVVTDNGVVTNHLVKE